MFSPDYIAAQFAAVFSANDALHQDMPLDCVNACAIGVEGEEELLRKTYSAPQLLFHVVPGILKHR
jgi:hypothetical protein